MNLLIPPILKKYYPLALIALAVLVVYGLWTYFADQDPKEGFASGNGRIEAVEVDIAAKLPGRVQEILVSEGEIVKAGQTLAKMQVDALAAQKDEALARQLQANDAINVAKAQVTLKESELDAAKKRLRRTQALVKEGGASKQELDDDQARVSGLQAALQAAKAQLTSAQSNEKASDATVHRLDVELQEGVLTAPRDGRIQYLVAQAGEVVGGGGKIMNLVDLSEVYMTFFLPETIAGKVAIGTEVRILLDVAPNFPIPAKVSFVANTAQFTPKTVETASERQKLMFRVKAQIDEAILKKYLNQVKVGLPGVAWVKLDPQKEWPKKLALRDLP